MAILLMSAYTSVNLPYSALSTELTPVTSLRTRLNAARFTGSILSGLSGLIVASVVLGQGSDGYLVMGRITGTIASVATLACCWGSWRPSPRQRSAPCPAAIHRASN